MAKRRSKAEISLEKMTNNKFYAYGSNVEFNIFNLSKISNEFKARVKSAEAPAEDPDAVMPELISKYREPMPDAAARLNA